VDELTGTDPLTPELPLAPILPPGLLSRSPAIFRFRVVIFIALYLLGFNVPWSRVLSAGTESTTWIVLSSLIANTGIVNLAYATLIVTFCAVAFGVAGAILRAWATAYLGAGVMNDKSLRADQIVAAGPYRYLRNPLYLGNLLTCAAVSILMPPAGAVLFLVGCSLLTASLVAAERPHLATQFGPAYEEYRRQVPAFVPAMRLLSSPARSEPRWGQALAAESFHVGFALCLVVLAWQYNVDLLVRCLLICFGISLVANGIFSARGMRTAEVPPA